MSNATADSTERQLSNRPQVTVEVPASVAAKNAKVNQVVDAMKKDPLFDRFSPYPAFMWKMANYYVTYGAEPPAWEQMTWAESAGVPPEVLRTGSGGGSGTNRANVIRSFETAILNRSSQLGMALPPETISYIARVAEAQDFSSEQLMNAIVELVDFRSIDSGQLTAAIDDMRALSRGYFVTLSDNKLQQYAKDLVSGKATIDGIESYLRAQSKAMNPFLAEYIDSGLTPAELFASSQDQIAKMLEIDPNAVDFTDDRFMKLATVTDDKGTTRLASNTELARNVRMDTDWGKTSAARTAATGTATLLAKIFGRSAF